MSRRTKSQRLFVTILDSGIPIARFANFEAGLGLQDLSNGTAHGGPIIRNKSSGLTWDERHGASTPSGSLAFACGGLMELRFGQIFKPFR